MPAAEALGAGEPDSPASPASQGWSTPGAVRRRSSQQLSVAWEDETPPAAGAAPQAQAAAFGSGSVFDVDVRAGAPAPFALPCARYLEESLLGMRVAPSNLRELLAVVDGDSQSPRRTSAGAAWGSSSPAGAAASLQWRRLRQVLSSAAAHDVCTAFFWLAVAVLFGRAREADVREAERSLARSWHRLNIEAGEVCSSQSTASSYMGARDETLDALPTLIVQAVFRLLVDAFDEERAEVVKQAEPLLDKLMLMVHYEASGFQMNVSTCRELRRKLFRQHVTEQPALDLQESLRLQQRRDQLERENTKGQHPLSFGPGGVGMEDLQLQSVLQNRRKEKKERDLYRRATGIPLGPDPGSPPFELTVDHYGRVRREGLARLDALRGATTEPTAGLGPGGGDHESDASASALEAAPAAQGEGGREAPEGVMTVALGKALAKKVRRSEVKAAERSRRKEQLRRHLLGESLPEPLRAGAIETCGVSPLCGWLEPKVDGRRLVEKRMRENFRLAMKTPPLPGPSAAAAEAQAARDPRAAPLPHVRKAPTARACARPSVLERGPQSAGAGRPAGQGRQAWPTAMGATFSTGSRASHKGGLSTRRGSLLAVRSAVALATGSRGDGDDDASSSKSDVAARMTGGHGNDILPVKITTDPAELRAAELAYVTSVHQLVGAAGNPAQSQWDSLKWRALKRDSPRRCITSGRYAPR
ncbi:unnamed protein product [Prorocentrum cordatum]|uniref:Uncharacterized protein n=1 Tax=Prorocentrum cordatum TaxID=2364126 RepID=A0ABN9VY58_9DINO|nr:unnamed protein product [Polarella glacialis]